MIEAFASDVRHAARGLLRSPGFALIAIATLTLGVGANTAIFSVVNATLLRPLPYPDADRLVEISAQAQNGAKYVASPPDFTDYRAQSQSFTAMAAINTGSWALSGDGPAEQVPGAAVTGDYFTAIGVQPVLGRTFTTDELAPGQGKAVVLSDALWRTRFGADPQIVGRGIRLDGETYLVAGVMPRGFAYPSDSRLWIPLAFNADELASQRGAHYLELIGRLKPGVTMDAADRDLKEIARRLRLQYPTVNQNESAAVTSMREWLVGDVRGTLLVLLGAVGFVLLIACVNVANLLLARGTGRRRELAVRAALGASGGRLTSIMLAESFCLGLAGALGGVALAAWGTDLVVAAAPDIPGIGNAHLDPVVLGFALFAGLATSVLFGLVPALRATGAVNLNQQLREGGSSLGGRSGHRARRVLVVAEVALAVVLVAGAGLLVKSLEKLRSVEPGFSAQGVTTFDVGLPNSYNAERSAAFYATLIERVRALPGVQGAGAIMGLPLSGFSFQISIHSLDGRELTPDEENALRSPQLRIITPDMPQTIGLELARGRVFTASDRYGAPPVILLNEAAAKLYFPGQDALGHHLVQGTRMGFKDRERIGGEVVGVLKDVHDWGLAADPRPTVYYPHDQVPVGSLSVAVKSAQDSPALINTLRAQLASVDADVPMYHARPMTDLLSGAVRAPRFFAMLLGIFAGLALALALIGVYGVLSQAVGERTREIGLRIALGAEPGRVQSLMIRQGLVPAAIGVAIGLAGAFGATRVLRRLLFQVSPTDAMTFVGVAAALMLTALAAAWLPARRAARVDPMVALRSD